MSSKKPKRQDKQTNYRETTKQGRQTHTKGLHYKTIREQFFLMEVVGGYINTQRPKIKFSAPCY